VGQVGNLRRIGNPPPVDFGITYGPIINRPQVANLPHKLRQSPDCGAGCKIRFEPFARRFSSSAAMYV
jgi:hypothetical protein